MVGSGDELMSWLHHAHADMEALYRAHQTHVLPTPLVIQLLLEHHPILPPAADPERSGRRLRALLDPLRKGSVRWRDYEILVKSHAPKKEAELSPPKRRAPVLEKTPEEASPRETAYVAARTQGDEDVLALLSSVSWSQSHLSSTSARNSLNSGPSSRTKLAVPNGTLRSRVLPRESLVRTDEWLELAGILVRAASDEKRGAQARLLAQSYALAETEMRQSLALNVPQDVVPSAVLAHWIRTPRQDREPGRVAGELGQGPRATLAYAALRVESNAAMRRSIEWLDRAGLARDAVYAWVALSERGKSVAFTCLKATWVPSEEIESVLCSTSRAEAAPAAKTPREDPLEVVRIDLREEEEERAAVVSEEPTSETVAEPEREKVPVVAETAREPRASLEPTPEATRPVEARPPSPEPSRDAPSVEESEEKAGEVSAIPSESLILEEDPSSIILPPPLEDPPTSEDDEGAPDASAQELSAISESPSTLSEKLVVSKQVKNAFVGMAHRIEAIERLSKEPILASEAELSTLSAAYDDEDADAAVERARARIRDLMRILKEEDP